MYPVINGTPVVFNGKLYFPFEKFDTWMDLYIVFYKFQRPLFIGAESEEEALARAISAGARTATNEDLYNHREGLPIRW